MKDDGSIDVYEKIRFQLEREYGEGYRSIRKEDFDSISDITVNSVKVNGADVPYVTQITGDQVEIVWKKTFEGENLVELDYTIADRVQLYNDFAKLCFEHYGANWPSTAEQFFAKTTLPPGSAGKTMHFEVYSQKQGAAYVEDMTINIEIQDVPSGNYVGGCYLFDRGSVQTDNMVDASAYDILKEEREIYGSKTVLEPEEPELEFCCLSVFLISAVLAGVLFTREKKRHPARPESILPPGKEEPIVVSSLVRNKYNLKELMAAIIVDLINRNVIDIVELRKKETKVGSGVKRERTILILKKRPANLKDYEKSVLDLIFVEGKEVDLDEMMERYNKIKTKTDANKMPIVNAVKKFNANFKKQVKSGLKDDEVKKLSKYSAGKMGFTGFGIGVFVFAAILVLAGGGIEDIGWYMQHGETLRLGIIVGCVLGFLAFAAYSIFTFLKAEIPTKKENLELYVKWDAFYRGLKASRIKEHPPASAVIWGDILKYATALGLAKKVKTHLSELDSALAHEIEVVDDVAISSMKYYSSAMAVHNLGRYGNRAGVTKASGGFSSRSSGGWSGGGGGFSGRSSGGGGFR